MNGSDLPGDLVILILSFLPVKSLLQFKCVCKSWYDLFLNPNFISKHNINSDYHRLVLGYHDLPNECGDFMIFDHTALDATGDVIGYRDLPNEFRFHDLDRELHSKCGSLYSHQRLLGSYNGLVCVADQFLKDFAFWNPATKQFKIVPQSNNINAKLERTEHAFGYDFKTNDYKVMRITPLTQGPPYKYGQIEVYSFYSGSWKNSDAVIPDGVCLDEAYDRPTICVKGFYSTMAYTTDAKDRELRNYFIFTIDMSNETFTLTPLPEKSVSFKASTWRNKVLTELKNSVAFIKGQAGPSEDEKSYDIFILNEYGPNGMWTKIYTIALGFRGWPIGFWKNDKLFFYTHSGSYGGLVFCDPRTSRWKKIDIDALYMQILEYKESLVWINDRRFGIEGKKKILDLTCFELYL